MVEGKHLGVEGVSLSPIWHERSLFTCSFIDLLPGGEDSCSQDHGDFIDSPAIQAQTYFKPVGMLGF